MVTLEASEGRLQSLHLLMGMAQKDTIRAAMERPDLINVMLSVSLDSTGLLLNKAHFLYHDMENNTEVISI